MQRTSPPSFSRQTVSLRAEPRPAAGAAGAPARGAARDDDALVRAASAVPPPRGLTVTGEVKNFVPVTDEMLRNPPPGDWLMVRRNYQAWSYSPLADITPHNVKDLHLAWVVGDERRRRQPDDAARPRRHHVSANTLNTVQALDGATGELIWENQRRPDQAIGFGSMRNIAHLRRQDPSRDHRRAAGRARRAQRQAGLGQPSSPIARKGFSNTSGPIVVRSGKIIQGLQGCDRYRQDRCFISAYDANTGKLLWKFHTIARKGEPGGDTWGKLPDMMRAGGETWIAGSYDPDLDLTYWGIAQAKPWMPVSRGTQYHRRRALHRVHRGAARRRRHRWRGTSSTFPANRSTSTKCSSACSSTSAPRRSLFTIGKAGILWKLDRATGKFLGAQGNGLPERLRLDRPEDRVRRRIAPTSSSRRSASGFPRARAPRADTTGRR